MTAGGRRPAGARRALLGLVALAGLAAACGGADTSTTPLTLVPVDGGTITIGIDQAPTGCNPDTATGDTWADQFVLDAVLPSAYLISPGGQAVGNQTLVPDAQLTSTSPQTVVYTLNPKAVWSDGVPITAADFIYAWQQQRGPAPAPGAIPPATAAPVATVQGYQDIKSVTGSNGGHTVTVVFKTPYADWASLFDDLMPAHVLQRTGWDPDCHGLDPAIDLSGGPYVLHAVTARSIELVANPHWWGAAPSASYLDIRVAANASQLARWEASGKTGVIESAGFTPSVLAALADHRGLSSAVKVSSSLLELDFATTAPATADTRVRLAIAHAVDRSALVTSVVGWSTPYVVPAASHLYSQIQKPYPSISFPSSMPNPLDDLNDHATTTTTGPPTAADPFPDTASAAASAQLMTAAGYTLSGAGRWISPTGMPVSLRLVVDEGDAWAAATAPLLAAQLDRAGFAVALSAAPSAQAAGETLAGGGADLGLLPVDTGPFTSEAVAWYTPLLGPPGVDGSQDWSDFDDPALNALLTKGAEQLNPVTGSVSYSQADALLWTQMPSLPLFAEPSLLAVNDDLYGIGPNPFGPNLLWYPQTWQIQQLQPSNDTTPHS